MALVSKKSVAAELGVNEETIDAWIQQGLLSADADGRIDQDEAFDVADTLGWLHLSGDSWDGGGE